MARAELGGNALAVDARVSGFAEASLDANSGTEEGGAVTALAARISAVGVHFVLFALLLTVVAGTELIWHTLAEDTRVSGLAEATLLADRWA